MKSETEISQTIVPPRLLEWRSRLKAGPPTGEELGSIPMSTRVIALREITVDERHSKCRKMVPEWKNQNDNCTVTSMK